MSARHPTLTATLVATGLLGALAMAGTGRTATQDKPAAPESEQPGPVLVRVELPRDAP